MNIWWIGRVKLTVLNREEEATLSTPIRVIRGTPEQTALFPVQQDQASLIAAGL
jgi:hypothetical protein